VDHYLPYHRQWLITHPLLAFLPFQSMFNECSQGVSSLHLPPSLVCSEHSTPSAACSFSVPHLFQLFYFFRAEVSLFRGLWWFIPGVAVGILCATYFLTCWSASPKQVWSQHLAAQEPSCFLSVMCHGKDLCGDEGLVFGVLILLGGFFCQGCLQHLSKILDLWSSRCLFLPSSHHLGSSFL
jgi:hypothetical protein